MCETSDSIAAIGK